MRALALLLLACAIGWWTWRVREELSRHEREVAELRVELEQKEARIRELAAALRLLKVDHRVARLEVLDCAPDAAGAARMRVRFTELTPEGAPLAPSVECTLAGTRVYVEALVIKFEDGYVERGEALRGTSVCLFQRLFGDEQKPVDGTPLDAAGQLPLAYGSEEGPDPFFTDLWRRFWDYAHDRTAAAAAGVRVMHGEAPFVEARAGHSYRVELRASGGLSLAAE